ncbi:uncharacterized protein SOCE26_066680 [Sorangium cellulosum]|uniref:LysR substrate-binding domain-containing protein n=1 Tax=Sorangium cellulosum TaxID=56 RepID=A0A2L0F0X8_SORCE|nr:hypothetical protein [Sorangium cellulosum]AUX45187.1 uncharacterized protein SOCE26_066680 [Sorangium cellulosum]
MPAIIAQEITSLRAGLRTAALPLALKGLPVELLWRGAVEDDEAVGFLRDLVARVASPVGRSGAAAPRGRRPAPPPC